jgi:NAD(P)-dependent dehydrogenase (short-subunit alcohol dehydrogenase family)
MPESAPVWFITGCSTGFGYELAKLILSGGGKAAVTARNPESLAELVEGHGDRALPLRLNVDDQRQIEAGVQAALDRFGRIDVLVNNAGYGYQAAIEEGVDAEIRAQFETNVFGLFAITRACLPAMRRQRRGHVINITSIGGLVGFAASGYYCASKHAIEGWSDTLAVETAPLGIKVTCVEPGPFRTDWAGRSLRQTPNVIADYAETAGARMTMTSGYSGQQPGDPVRAAQAIIDIALSEHAPRHLVMGAFAFDTATKRLKARLDEIEAWRETALATDYPNA